MANILKLHQKAAASPLKEPTNPFQKYGLKSNPFPSMALFNSTADDPRRNGTIYDRRFRAEEELRFLQMFLQTTGGAPPPALGFVRLGPQVGSRGSGKSAFLHHLMQRVNKQDWDGLAIDPESPDLLALAVHLLPHPRIHRTFADLVRLIFVTMAQHGLFALVDRQVRAAMFVQIAPEERVEALAALDAAQVDALFESDTSFRKLLVDERLTEQEYLDALRRTIQEDVKAPDKNRFLFEYLQIGSLERLWEGWARDRFENPRLRKELADWFVDGLAPILMAGGYRRMIVLVDEFEKIFIYQTDRMREEFLDTLRQRLYEQDSAAARKQFVTTVLTLHPSIERELAIYWERVGLKGVAPLHDVVRSRSVELRAPTRDRLVGLLTTYLDGYRTDSRNMGTPLPFARDAMDELVERAGLVPRDALRLAHDSILAAARDAINVPIPLVFVRSQINLSLQRPQEGDEFDELPELDVDTGDGAR